ncbi:Transducin/WD40 repeat-like superfamily protein [Striga hermonthica]|uniref:Transducin/WD40 repeat-like superfamily protein n=1 Tax=Striga hermonthica TaxID=68872 RepID=A0A9N7R8X3_STRHE|nr:Transducin/WD40 repeat-like superfamily protein [Striga hermonthica]
MSTPSARRLKERGGGGTKIAAPPSRKISPVAGKSISMGKENPRSTSRVRSAAQRPDIRPMARTDKFAVEEPRSKWSISSVPRGRSSSPAEFTRVLSDLRKNSSRVSMDPPQRKEKDVSLNGLIQKFDLEERVFKGLVKNGKNLGELEGGFHEKVEVKVKAVSNRISDKMVGKNLASVPPERADFEKLATEDIKRNAGNVKEKDKIHNRVSNGSSENMEHYLNSSLMKSSNLENSDAKSTLEFELKSSNFSGDVKMKFCSGEALSGPNSVESTMVRGVSKFPTVPKENVQHKNPSKLQEKLAFLEDKVKRIASDINRTKELLDLNNVDASKMILSDIQAKITGIENAMVHVGRDGDVEMGLVRSKEIKEKGNEKIIVDSKSLVKGLSAEEIEARLFPHHKLLRDRALSRTTSRDSETDASIDSCNVNTVKVTSLDENDITSEFLASLCKEEYRDESKTQETDESKTCVGESSSLNALSRNVNLDALLMAEEKLDEFDDQELEPAMGFDEGLGENNTYKLNDIGCKTSIGGWLVSEGESVLLAHDDGSCSFYDTANCERKAEYKPPLGILPNTWQDCWMIRAPSADGCSSRYVVAASAGSSVGSGFCSWDFYTKGITAFHTENEKTTSARTALAPLPNNTMYRKKGLSTFMANENLQWWYKPCGPLITSTASCQRTVHIYDIRDGEQVMKWELQKPVLAMDSSSPLHWRNRGKVVIAESDGISLWDVNSLSSHALMSVSSCGRKISALHVNNTDAELSGGVRQRINSLDAEGNDGVFGTPDSINVLDFRNPSGIGLKIPIKIGTNMYSAFSCGDHIYTGCSTLKSVGKNHCSSQIQQFSLRKQQLFSTYELPESNNAQCQSAKLTQVWGDSSFVMGICGLGLFVFDSLKDDRLLLPYEPDNGGVCNVREVIGPDDMYCPSFDYSASRVLIISRDRPARWRYLV